MDNPNIPPDLEMTAHLLDAGDWRKKPSKWTITLRRRGQEMVTPWTAGTALREWRYQADSFGTLTRTKDWRQIPQMPKSTIYWAERLDESRPTSPSLDDVLAALVSDASLVRHGQSLSEFGADLGITDLQYGIETWESCHKTWQGLTRLGLDLDALEAWAQDY